MPTPIKATVIGFSRDNCKHCLGRGRIGYDLRYGDNLHVIPCSCVEFFDLEKVQESWERDRKAAQEQEQRTKANAVYDQSEPSTAAEQFPVDHVAHTNS